MMIVVCCRVRCGVVWCGGGDDDDFLLFAVMDLVKVL